MKKLIFVLASLFVLFPVFKPVFAVTGLEEKLIVTLTALPEYERSTDFRVYYTYFNTKGNTATVNLYIQKDGKDWRQTVTRNKTAVSGYFQMEGSDIYDGSGKYNFYAEAKTADQTIKSETVFTTLDDAAPSAPTEYSKERLNATTYKLSWKNPFDEDFSKVYIYRSKDTSFTADSSTRIGESGGDKNQYMTYNDGSVEADVTYYYALRAIDRAGNASGVVTDAPGTVTAGSVAGAATTGTLGTTGSQTAEGEVVLLPDTETATPEEETTDGQLGGGTASESTGEVQGATAASRRPWLIAGAVLVLGLAALFVFLNRRKAE